jgi:hypothetical protein
MRQEGPTTDCGSASSPPRLAMTTFAAPHGRARQRSVQRMQPASRFWAPEAYCSKNTKSSMEENVLFSTFFCEIQLFLYDYREIPALQISRFLHKQRLSFKRINGQ